MQLQNIVSETLQGPRTSHLVDAAQEELSEGARLFDPAICPKTGSTMALRVAWTFRPVLVRSLRLTRSTRAAPFGSGPRAALQPTAYTSKPEVWLRS